LSQSKALQVDVPSPALVLPKFRATRHVEYVTAKIAGRNNDRRLVDGWMVYHRFFPFPLSPTDVVEKRGLDFL
jgi:hypothetical protein